MGRTACDVRNCRWRGRGGACGVPGGPRIAYDRTCLSFERAVSGRARRR